MKKSNAFTLIELLAVIVILAVILVIAIPRILDVIEESKKDSFKNSAQLIADTAEKKKVSDKLLGKDEEITCKDVAKISDEDYASCIITFDSDGIAKVSITGKGKFDGLKITNGTKENAEVKEITKPTYGMKATEYITNLLEYDGVGLKKDNTPDQNIRYYGSNPNNYVRFNNELWRIIGVFGDNVKLIRSESLGSLSWDSSESSINGGCGVNEWSQADLKNYLNTMYYGGTSVTCYNGQNNQTTTCPTGTIDETSKGLIDYHTWNTGAIEYETTTDTIKFYKAERGRLNGKICSSGSPCNDTIIRTTTWTGYIGLPYATDWAYASGENICETNMQAQDSSNAYVCKNNNWIYQKSDIRIISSIPNLYTALYVWVVSEIGSIQNANASETHSIFPALYLKSNVLIDSGNGTSSNPYTLKLNN